MFIEKLKNAWSKNNSMMAVGLDPEQSKLPKNIQKYKDSIFQFNKEIIDATSDLVCAYKFQIAFYSAKTAEDQLLKTIQYIKQKHSWLPIILDAKRGDIGPVSEMYAQEAFDRYGVDALTVNPYLGTDSLKPFLDRKDKGVIVVCATSNPGGQEFQNMGNDSEQLYLAVAKKAAQDWNYNDNVLLVAGATHPEKVKLIRNITGEMVILAPGIGFQSGNLEEAVYAGKAKKSFGLILSSSRSVIYASSNSNFAEAARNVVANYREKSTNAAASLRAIGR